MNTAGLFSLIPLMILGAGMVIAMLAIAFRRNHGLVFGITLATFVLSFLSILPVFRTGSGQVTPLLIFDGYANFIIGLVIAASVVVSLLAYGYFKNSLVQAEEFYLLLMSAVLGSCVLAASSHFASLFLGLEILSISLYAMVSFSFKKALSIEAGVKYLILASSSAAFLLFGMALIYAQTGTMEFAKIGSGFSNPIPFLSLAGIVMMLVGFGFKLALVPFHLWTPDVYEGAPAPVTAFIASISKGSMFAVMLRFFFPFNILNQASLMIVFVIIAVATMLVGSLLALLQTNLKRLLAYSSIANLGYLLVAFLAGGANAVAASTFYLVSYFITILAAFGVISVLSNNQQDAGKLEGLRGLMWRRPWLAAILTAAMFSLAGIPLTVGFVGKFFVVLAGVGSALWLLVITLVISSAIGLFYYLRVVVTMFSSSTEKAATPATTAPLPLSSGLALGGLLVLLIWLGVYPSPLIQFIQSLASTVH
jgi:NADH-quinone oxidoreductase subunit N